MGNHCSEIRRKYFFSKELTKLTDQTIFLILNIKSSILLAYNCLGFDIMTECKRHMEQTVKSSKHPVRVSALVSDLCCWCAVVAGGATPPESRSKQAASLHSAVMPEGGVLPCNRGEKSRYCLKPWVPLKSKSAVVAEGSREKANSWLMSSLQQKWKCRVRRAWHCSGWTGVIHFYILFSSLSLDCFSILSMIIMLITKVFSFTEHFFKHLIKKKGKKHWTEIRQHGDAL